ncbi:hypothetical protein JHD50_01645 [Sulfurimonas sp. MAG313]|nr:hypothetical protein [Sulfurimonas sp. MAG313]
MKNGQLQEIMNQLDGFAAGLIESTNNLYAQGAQTSMVSDRLSLEANATLKDSTLNFREGSFDMIAYDINGDEAARRTITVTSTTVMDDSLAFPPNGSSNSIIGQLKAQIDDNSDGNAINDINSILSSVYSYNPTNISGELSIQVNENDFPGYTFGIEDDQSNGLASGSNFAGALGMSRFFQGDDATNINLNSTLKKDPSIIRANKSPVDGDNKLANDMLQLQFENVEYEANGLVIKDSLYGYYDALVTDVGTRTNAAIITNETVAAKYNSILLSYESISKVNIDEEMVNLIKYQTAYSAAAKIITTIDQMLDTLLGLKQ